MTHRRLNSLFTQVAPGAPLAPEDLHLLGISSDLAVHYARAGWLTRIAHGVYCLPNSPLDLDPSLRLLQRRLAGLHVGGKSALDWHGMRQYLTQRPALQLYGWEASRLPHWFTQRFTAEYHRKRLFREQSAEPRHIVPLEMASGVPLVSTPERAVLELLSEVGVRQSLPEARKLLAGAGDLRADVLRDLLRHCTSVKTVRLCLQLGRECALPWAGKLDPRQLPTGSARPWVSRSPEGLLSLKP